MIITFSLSAERQLEDIRQQSRDHWGQAHAVEYIDGLITAIERLRTQPEMGRRRDEFRLNLRSITYRPYTIFYTLLKDEVRITAIIHGSRDLRARADEP
ncbi:MAG: type II toxin-antitoxin system RelE/ParE family toxin [Pseudomonadota bacterium]